MSEICSAIKTEHSRRLLRREYEVPHHGPLVNLALSIANLWISIQARVARARFQQVVDAYRALPSVDDIHLTGAESRVCLRRRLRCS